MAAAAAAQARGVLVRAFASRACCRPAVAQPHGSHTTADTPRGHIPHAGRARSSPRAPAHRQDERGGGGQQPVQPADGTAAHGHRQGLRADPQQDGERVCGFLARMLGAACRGKERREVEARAPVIGWQVGCGRGCGTAHKRGALSTMPFPSRAAGCPILLLATPSRSPLLAWAAWAAWPRRC